MGVIAFIPAKMTSRRLPGKNMRLLCGRPLLYYSIRAAQLTKSVSEVVVSSEDSQVLEYAQELGAQIHRREPELARADVRTTEVMGNWWTAAPRRSNLVALLQPTHPVRDPGDLSKAIEVMSSDPEADSLFTVVPLREVIGAVHDFVFVPEAATLPGRIDVSTRFKVTGSFYLFRPERTFLSDEPFGRRIRVHEMTRPECEVDVDYEHDLACAEAVFRSNPTILARYD